MREERKETLQKLCLAFRSKLIDLLYSIQTGHPGGSLSCTEILTALYYELMDVDPMNPEKDPSPAVRRRQRPPFSQI